MQPVTARKDLPRSTARDIAVAHDIARIVAFVLATFIVIPMGLRPSLWWLVIAVTIVGVMPPALRLKGVIERDVEVSMIIDLYYGAVLAALGGRLGAVSAAVVGTLVISATVLPALTRRVVLHSSIALGLGSLVNWVAPADGAADDGTNAIAAWAVLAMLAVAASIAVRAQRRETSRLGQERDLAKAQLMTAMDVSNVALLTVDGKGQIRAAAGWSNMGLEPGNTYAEALGWLPDAVRMLDEALAGHQVSASMIVGEKVLHVAASPTSRRDSLDGASLALSDITDPVASSRRAEQESRWKSDFIATVSHELRTPLTAVLGFAQMMGGESDDPGALADYVGIVIEQAQEASNIVEDLLVVSRQDVGDLTFLREPVDLLEASATVVRGLGDRAASVSLHGEPLSAMGDQVRIRQIVRNLVTNAIKYGGDDVMVEVGRRADQVVLTVSDDGSGIPLVARDLVFKAFYQVGDRRVPDGIGLGLHVARSLAQAMGGDLTYAYLGGRSRFALVLPPAGAEDVPVAV